LQASYHISKHYTCNAIHAMHVHAIRWLGSSAVRALDTRPKGPRFNSQPVDYQVTTLGKLFIPTCLCGCRWSSGYCRNFQVAVRFSLPIICKQPWASC